MRKSKERSSSGRVSAPPPPLGFAATRNSLIQVAATWPLSRRYFNPPPKSARPLPDVVGRDRGRSVSLNSQEFSSISKQGLSSCELSYDSGSNAP